MIEQVEFIYSPLGKDFEKQTKTVKDQGKKKQQMKALEEHEQKLVESNELVNNNFNIDRDSIPFDEQKIYLIDSLKKNLMSFRI